MIYTLTLNPAIDLLIDLPSFHFGTTNKVTKQVKLLGGKGINVAVMTANFNQPVTALGFMTNSQATEFQDYLVSKKVQSNFTQIDGSVRTNLKIHSQVDDIETEINCLGFTVNQNQLDILINNLKKLLKPSDVLLISGSIAPGCQTNPYQMIAAFCHQQKINFAIDTTNYDLLSTLQYQPILIKPNLAELNQIFQTNYDFSDLSKIIMLGQNLQKKGAQNVLISNGKIGSLLITETGNYYVNSAKGKLVSSVGAGDSMFAAFMIKYLTTNNLEIALQYAAAAGSSTAFTVGIADINQIEKNLKQIIIKKI